MATISGTNDGTYKGAIVRAYIRDTGVYVGCTQSDPSTGAWSITTASTAPHIAIALPVAGDVNEAYKVFGVDFNGTNGGTIALDVKERALTWEGSVALSTAQYIGGATSAGAFGGGTQRVKTPITSTLKFPAGTNFTLETWVYPTSTPGAQSFVFGDDNEAAYNGLGFGFNGGNSFINIPNATEVTGSGATLNISAWNHIGFTATTSGYFRAFIGGTRTINSNLAGYDVWTGSNNLCLGNGRYGSAAKPFVGYIGPTAIYRGLEKWTTSFTAPAAPQMNSLGTVNYPALIFDNVIPI